MMKRIIALSLFIALLVVSFNGCKKQNALVTENSKPIETEQSPQTQAPEPIQISQAYTAD